MAQENLQCFKLPVLKEICKWLFSWNLSVKFPSQILFYRGILVHGMGGSEADWQTWVELLSQRFPDWILWPLQKLKAACSFLGRDLRDLSKMAAAEISEVVRNTQSSSLPGQRSAAVSGRWGIPLGRGPGRCFGIDC